MIFELAQDFHDAVAAMPKEHPKHRMLELLEEAIRRDIHFIARHSTTMFQCLWNTCWWYDCPEAAKHYEEPEGGWKEPPPWENTLLGFHRFSEIWRTARELTTPGVCWLRSLRPPFVRLGAGQQAVLWIGGSVMCVSISPSGQFAAIGSIPDRGGCKISVWDIPSGRQVTVITQKSLYYSGEMTVHFLSDGCHIANVDRGGQLRVWDVLSGAQMLVRDLDLPECGIAPGLSVSNGKIIATAHAGGQVRLWDALSGALRRSFSNHAQRCIAFAFSPEGDWFATVSENGLSRLWDVRSGVETASFQVHAKVVSAALGPAGECLVIGTEGGELQVWNTYGMAELGRIRAHSEPVKIVAFSPDGCRVASASGGFDRTVRLWDVRNGKELRAFRGHQEWITSVAFLPDGGRVVTTSSDQTVRIWNVQSQVDNIVLANHDSNVTNLAIAPDGQRVATVSDDKTLRLWHIPTGVQSALVRGHQQRICDVTFSMDGSRGASLSEDGMIRVWDARCGADLVVFRTQVTFLAGSARIVFSPSGRYLACTMGAVCVVDIATGQWQEQFRGLATSLLKLSSVEGMVESAAFSHDGRLLATGSRYGRVRIWDPLTATSLALLDNVPIASPNGVTRIAFSPDGHRIASVSKRGVTMVRDIADPTCCEIIHGVGDAAAIAAGSIEFPYRALACDNETVIESASDRRLIGWFPYAISISSASRLSDDYPFPDVCTHPNGRIWAGATREHVQFIVLEGGESS